MSKSGIMIAQLFLYLTGVKKIFNSAKYPFYSRFKSGLFKGSAKAEMMVLVKCTLPNMGMDKQVKVILKQAGLLADLLDAK
ncbi:MAG: hypothetical protein ABIN97_06735 [Ginsengibacter sp.]